jgi:hypothetical protein
VSRVQKCILWIIKKNATLQQNNFSVIKTGKKTCAVALYKVFDEGMSGGFGRWCKMLHADNSIICINE